MSTQDKAGPSIVRVQKNANYSVIFNEVARRRDLSARAKGIFFYVMTLPDDWKFYKREIYGHFSEGRQALDKAWAELEKAGYIHKEPARAEGGKLAGWNYTVVESVQSVQSTDSLKTRVTVKPNAVNQPLLSTDSSLSTNLTNEDQSVSAQVPPATGKYIEVETDIGYVECSRYRLRELEEIAGKEKSRELIARAFDYASATGKAITDYAWFALQLNGYNPQPREYKIPGYVENAPFGEYARRESTPVPTGIF